MMTVSLNSVVAFRYIMRDEQANILENTLSGVPTRYLYGSDAIANVLQEQMSGMAVGEKRNISLLLMSGHGNGNYFFEIVIDALREATEAEMELGYPLESDEVHCPADCECHEQN